MLSTLVREDPFAMCGGRWGDANWVTVLTIYHQVLSPEQDILINPTANIPEGEAEGDVRWRMGTECCEILSSGHDLLQLW